ncbi:MAG: histidinol-phosphatase HisJ family protein [Clostridia bacterium]|nr:histidinol-phosphatase HisJ family protein [Clostridia bacterium]
MAGAEKRRLSRPGTDGPHAVSRSPFLLGDFHVHSTFSDGKSAPEDVVLAAIARGMRYIGFSDHSHTPHDESYCMRKERAAEYRGVIARLREKYSDRITVLCGVEQDYYSDMPSDGYDYVIGSVHYIRAGGEFCEIDGRPERLVAAAEKYFGGSIAALSEVYYETVSDVAAVTGADIVGHFDLLTKHNGGGKLFSESDPVYISAWTAAADRLLAGGRLFEINTGAISRGYRHSPYPSAEQRRYIFSHGGRFILSGDSHRPENLCFGFEDLVSEPGLITPEEFARGLKGAE